jgi:hypothetical protein
MSEQRMYYHILWTAIARGGSSKEVPLVIGAGDGERVVLLFDTFDRAKEFMHEFLVAKGIVDKQTLQPDMAVITVAHPILGSRYPGHIFSPSPEPISADAHARAGRKSGVNYALVNPARVGSLTARHITRARVPMAEL